MSRGTVKPPDKIIYSGSIAAGEPQHSTYIHLSISFWVVYSHLSLESYNTHTEIKLSSDAADYLQGSFIENPEWPNQNYLKKVLNLIINNTSVNNCLDGKERKRQFRMRINK